MTTPQTPLALAELAATFAAMRVLDASLDKRLQLARQLLDAGFSRRHLVALVRKVSSATSPGGMAVKILHGDWRTELETHAAATVRRDGAQDRYSHTEELTRDERAKRSGMPVAEFERDRRITIAIEHLQFGRTIFDSDGEARHETPTAEQLAGELGLSLDAFQAEIAERQRRFAEGVKVEPATEPLRLCDHNKNRMLLNAELAKERAAIREEGTDREPFVQPPPIFPNVHRFTAERGHERNADFWNQQLAEADRAWAERFPMFRFIDPKMHKAMLAGPEPRPWVERAIRASADRIAGKNPKWSGRHADHRPRAK